MGDDSLIPISDEQARHHAFYMTPFGTLLMNVVSD